MSRPDTPSGTPGAQGLSLQEAHERLDALWRETARLACQTTFETRRREARRRAELRAKLAELRDLERAVSLEAGNAHLGGTSSGSAEAER